MSLNDIVSGLASVANMLKSRDANQVADELMQNNPQFREFMNKYRNSSIEDIARSEGVNLNLFNQVLRMLGLGR